ncbi:MAG TPA: YdcF family protein [Stellaceae bacterium]|nr:YdcF family protein [Stellaceae bacterium]
MPPTVFVFTVLVGGLLALVARTQRYGLALTLASGAALYVFSMPVTAALMLRAIEAQIPETTRDFGESQAIVILAGTIHHGDGGATKDSVGALTLERLDRAVQIYRRTKLPILVSGGPIGDSQTSLAALMATTLTQDFGVPVAWREEKSQTTYEDAQETARILNGQNIHVIALVTQPWHMPRAIWSFAQQGLDVIPAPTARTVLRTPIDSAMILPSTDALEDSFYALHEAIGLAYYKLRFGGAGNPASSGRD